MSWLGESLTNLKGQISSFTKEVLAETPEENAEFAEGDELRIAKAKIAELEAICTHQKQEIEHFQVLSTGLKEKSDALDIQNRSLVDSYQKLLQSKDEENKVLSVKVEKLVQEVNAIRNEEAKEIVGKVDAGLQTSDDVSCTTKCTLSVPCQTETTESTSVTTETDSDLQGEGADDPGVPNALDDSYLRELEERCSEYQTDLYALRAELMTLQADVDQSEEAKANLSEDILNLLHSSFIIDGKPALGKVKHSGFESSIEAEQNILSALRQLGSIWKSLLDKKATLERTVAKLATHSKCKAAEDQVDLGINLSHCSTPSNNGTSHISAPGSSSSSALIPAIDFFQPKVDSFGLETIIEEERAEDDNRSTEADRDAEGLAEEPLLINEPGLSSSSTTNTDTETTTVSAPSDKTATSPSPSVNIKEVCSSFTQTDQDDQMTGEGKVSEEELKAQIFATLEGTWLSKEKDWISKVEEKENRITKLQADLERLQNHLVDLEEQYTNEALAGEEKEKQLRLQIAELQKEITQTIRQNDKNGDVQNEIVRLTAERDYARASNSSLEEQLQKMGTQLQNLHFVLEQFQKEKEQEITEVQRGIQGDLKALEATNRQLQKELETEKGLLLKARTGLEAAQQLNLQIEDKSRLITQLKNQVQEKEEEVTRLSKHLEEINNNNVAKIDRYLVKNLIVGYFTTPADKRTEVLRVIATVLDFNREDRQRTGLESTSMWPFGRGGGTEAGDSARQQSFTSAFIRFLEAESQPKTQIQIPLDEMTRRNSKSSGPSTPVFGTPGAGDASSRHSSTSSPGLSEMSVNLPVLNQADRSNSILKDVLNNPR